MSSNFGSLLVPGCDLSQYESNNDKFVAVITSIQLGLFKSMLTAEILSEIFRDAGVKGGYGGRDVYEMLDDVRAKTLDALHVVADDKTVELMRCQYQEEVDA